MPSRVRSTTMAAIATIAVAAGPRRSTSHRRPRQPQRRNNPDKLVIATQMLQ
jgi:hypothetical protein